MLCALSLCVALASAACTPIAAVKSAGADGGPKDEAGDAQSADISTQGSPGPDSGSVLVGTPAEAQSACEMPDARACSAGSASEVLLCREGTWQLDESCKTGDSCVSDGDGTRCAAPLAYCANQDPGYVYCDADAKRRVCLSATQAKELACEELERCVVEDGMPKCRCVPGAIDMAGCVIATSCDVDRGGCDPETDCMPSAEGRTCGPCPSGFEGNGEQGCKPQLVTFESSCGTLDPPLTAGTYEYRLRVPLLCQAPHLEGTTPPQSRVRVQADELPAEFSWDMPPIHVGETPLPINVTSSFSVTSKYTVTVERSGAQEAYLKASNASANDCFGIAVATLGEEEVAIGAMREDGGSATDPTVDGASDSGAVYIFGQQGDSWVQLHYLKPDPPRAGEAFGSSIAAEADTLAIGAPNGDPLEWYAGIPASERAGAVYIFERDNGAWVQKQRLVPDPSMDGNMFGSRIALRGGVLLVGAPDDAADGSASGAVYVFARQNGTGSWEQQQRLTPTSPRADSRFGLSVALDDERIVVGAPHHSALGENVGAAFTFTRAADGTWQQEQRLDPEPARARATFGWQVAVDRERVFVSAPSVFRNALDGQLFAYVRGADGWTQHQTLQAQYPAAADLYGGGLALSGKLMVVGANGDSSGASGLDGDSSRTDAYQAGAAFMYALQDDGSWVPTTYLKAEFPDADDTFGVSLALSASRIFIASPFESGASRKINGDANNNGSSRSGAVYVFH